MVYGSQFHSKRWLKISKRHVEPTLPQGWRPYTWTPALDEAEKFSTEEGARLFGSSFCHGPFEVAEIAPVAGFVGAPA